MFPSPVTPVLSEEARLDVSGHTHSMPSLRGGDGPGFELHCSSAVHAGCSACSGQAFLRHSSLSSVNSAVKCMQLALALWMRTVLLLRRPLRSGVGPGRGSPPGSVLDSRSAEVCGQLAAWGAVLAAVIPASGSAVDPQSGVPVHVHVAEAGFAVSPQLQASSSSTLAVPANCLMGTCLSRHLSKGESLLFFRWFCKTSLAASSIPDSCPGPRA